MSELLVSLKITADGAGLVGTMKVSKQELDKLKKSFDHTGNSADKTARKIDKAETAFKRLRGTAGRVHNSFSALRTTVAGAIAALGVREVYQATRSWEGYFSALKAVTGSNVQAAREINFVRKEAERLGVGIHSLLPAYTKLSAAAKGTILEGQGTRDIFTSITEASKVFNLTADQTAGALTAVEQMMSKGKVSTEELRGQLGERLAGAFNTAATAMGVTTSELDKMLEQGEVLATDFLPRFAKVLREQVSEGLDDASKNTSASVARMGNAWDGLLTTVSALGLNKAIKGGADLMARFFNWGKVAVVEFSGAVQIAWIRIRKVVSAVVLGISSAWSGLMNGMRSGLALVMDLASKVANFVGADMARHAALLRKGATESKIFSKTLREQNREYENQITAIRSSNTVLIESFNATDSTVTATKKATAAIAAYTPAQQKLIDKLLPGRAAAVEYYKALEELNKLNLDTETHALAVSNLNKGLLDSIVETKQAAKEVDEIYKNLGQGIQSVFADTFKDVFDNGIDGFEDFTKKMLDMFKGVLAEMAAAAAAKQLMPSILGGVGAVNPMVGLGVLAGGLVLSSILSSREQKRQREAERAQAMEDLSNLSVKVSQSIRLLNGELTNLQASFETSSIAELNAFNNALNTNSLKNRAVLEKVYFEAVNKRYELEQKVLNELMSSVETIYQRVLQLQNDISSKINNILGVPKKMATIEEINEISILPFQDNPVMSARQALNDAKNLQVRDQVRLDQIAAELFNQKFDVISAPNEFVINDQRFGLNDGTDILDNERPNIRRPAAPLVDLALITKLEAEQDALKDQMALRDIEINVLNKKYINAFITLGNSAKDYISTLNDQLDILDKLNTQTQAYYDAQVALAELYRSSAANARATVTSIARQYMSPNDRVKDMYAEFKQLQSAANIATGADQAKLVDQLAGMSQSLISEARNAYGSGGSFQAIFNDVTGSLTTYADILDANAAEAEVQAEQAEQALIAIKAKTEEVVDGIDTLKVALVNAINDAKNSNKNLFIALLETLGGDTNIEINIDSVPISNQVIQKIKRRNSVNDGLNTASLSNPLTGAIIRL